MKPPVLLPALTGFDKKLQSPSDHIDAGTVNVPAFFMRQSLKAL